MKRADSNARFRAVLAVAAQAAASGPGGGASALSLPVDQPEEELFVDTELQGGTSKEAAFRAIDVNGDGELDSDEILSVLRSLGQEVEKADVKRLIAQVDKDGNGTIGYA